MEDTPTPEVRLGADPCVLRMTIEVTRAATGKTETVELIGTPMNEGESVCLQHTQSQ